LKSIFHTNYEILSANVCCDLTICSKFTIIRTKWSYCCGNSLAGPPVMPNGIMVH